MMKEKLRTHIETLFSDAPNTKKAIELKEELIQNSYDKYDDLILEGKTPEAAYNISVASIGDITYLIEDLKKDMITVREETIEKGRKRSAFLVSAAVMLYIMSIIPIILLSEFGLEIQGVVLMFLLIAVATGLLIYNGMTKTSYKKKDQTIAEEFREWKSENADRIKARKAISSALWMIVVVVYLLISFWTMHWGITWIIFLIAAAVDNIIKAIFELTKK